MDGDAAPRGTPGRRAGATQGARGAPGDAGQLVRRMLAESAAWSVAEQLPLAVLNAVPNVTRLQVQLLHNRGISGVAAIRSFMAADWGAGAVNTPMMARAVERIRAAIAGGEHILVYGDHDADGITSCAVLVLALRLLGAAPDAYIPKRDDDGRGLNPAALDDIAGRGVSLIITTDCGTANVAEVEHARSLGLEVIITDHHPPLGPHLPAAVAIVNPYVEKDGRFDVHLAGVGVAFRLAQALLGPERHDDLHDLLDLVAIGTVADVVPLSPGNWALAHSGLRCLNERPRPGLAALLRAARVAPGSVTERDIGFVIAPRLNAAPRLGLPEKALALLLAADAPEANRLAAELDALNVQRQDGMQALLEEARAQVKEQLASVPKDAPRPSMLMVEGDDWSFGLLGLVAGRLADEYEKPAFAVSRYGAESRGSGRGPEGFDLGAALAARSELFVRFGGHARAAGFTLATDDLATLRAHLGEALARQRDDHAAASASAAADEATPALKVDCPLPLDRVKPDRYEAIRALAPFGPGFAEPHFLCANARIMRCWRSGPEGRNLRLTIHDGSAARPALWSRHGDWCDDIQAAVVANSLPRFNIVYTLDGYQRDGELQLTMRIVALRPVADEQGELA